MMTNAAPNNVLEYQLFTLIKLNFFQNYALAQFTHTRVTRAKLEELKRARRNAKQCKKSMEPGTIF